MTKLRSQLKANVKKSQGAKHEFKSVCATSVVDFFGATEKVHYLHTIEDVVRAIRTTYTVRSRKSSVKKGSSVGSVRSQLKKLGEGYYVVRVDGHVLLLNADGDTIVDTDPRKRDRRKITHLYKVFVEEPKQYKDRRFNSNPYSCGASL